ncbi:MAG: hypothetical protein GTO49_10435 [Anaerolineae bacterium]|nr:hypothetical protein [Anaerolineae bacterium]
MEKRRIFVLCKNLLFCRALETLIAAEEIEVVGIETDGSRAMENIKLLKPEIVVVETGGEDILLDNFLPYLLRESPGSKVVGLSLAQNEIDVYYGHQRLVRKAEDLVKVISES